MDRYKDVERYGTVRKSGTVRKRKGNEYIYKCDFDI